MIKAAVIAASAVALLGVAIAYYLFRPLPKKPQPAELECYDLSRGSYVPLEAPPRAFGIGLSYAGHIEETASSFDPDAVPPVFRKDVRALARTDAEVPMPDLDAICEAAEGVEPGLGEKLRGDHETLSPLLDYEVEMGVVLLERIDPASLDDPAYIPPLGFFIANDLSARTLAILGDGQPSTMDYWGASKSFPGFMPVADKAWVPDEPIRDAIPCVVIETLVNGEVRQRQSTRDLIYTPRQMLAFIHATYPDAPLDKGTIVLTGTPSGVAVKTPRSLVRLSKLLGMSRFTKLEAKLRGDTEAFLKPGDQVVVRGKGLGKVAIQVAPASSENDP